MRVGARAPSSASLRIAPAPGLALSFPATSRPATRAPGPADQESPRFSLPEAVGVLFFFPTPRPARPGGRGQGDGAPPFFPRAGLPSPLPSSPAEDLLFFPPPIAQPMPGQQTPGFPPAAPSSFRWPSRAALEFAAALSRTLSPQSLAPVAPRLARARTTLLHPYKETVFPAAGAAPPASSPDVPARTVPRSPPARNIHLPALRRH